MRFSTGSEARRKAEKLSIKNERIRKMAHQIADIFAEENATIEMAECALSLAKDIMRTRAVVIHISGV